MKFTDGSSGQPKCSQIDGAGQRLAACEGCVRAQGQTVMCQLKIPRTCVRSDTPWAEAEPPKLRRLHRPTLLRVRTPTRRLPAPPRPTAADRMSAKSLPFPRHRPAQHQAGRCWISDSGRCALQCWGCRNSIRYKPLSPAVPKVGEVWNRAPKNQAHPQPVWDLETLGTQQAAGAKNPSV